MALTFCLLHPNRITGPKRQQATFSCGQSAELGWRASPWSHLNGWRMQGRCTLRLPSVTGSVKMQARLLSATGNASERMDVCYCFIPSLSHPLLFQIQFYICATPCARNIRCHHQTHLVQKRSTQAGTFHTVCSGKIMEKQVRAPWTISRTWRRLLQEVSLCGFAWPVIEP